MLLMQKWFQNLTLNFTQTSKLLHLENRSIYLLYQLYLCMPFWKPKHSWAFLQFIWYGFFSEKNRWKQKLIKMNEKPNTAAWIPLRKEASFEKTHSLTHSPFPQWNSSPGVQMKRFFTMVSLPQRLISWK